MTIRQVPYTECAGCGKPLYPGNLVVSFCRSIEQLDYTKEFPRGEITVADCVELLTLCADCGNKLHVTRATAVLQAAVQHPQFSRN